MWTAPYHISLLCFSHHQDRDLLRVTVPLATNQSQWKLLLSFLNPCNILRQMFTWVLHMTPRGKAIMQKWSDSRSNIDFVTNFETTLREEDCHEFFQCLVIMWSYINSCPTRLLKRSTVYDIVNIVSKTSVSLMASSTSTGLLWNLTSSKLK